MSGEEKMIKLRTVLSAMAMIVLSMSSWFLVQIWNITNSTRDEVRLLATQDAVKTERFNTLDGKIFAIEAHLEKVDQRFYRNEATIQGLVERTQE